MEGTVKAMATLCTGWQLSMIEVDREVFIYEEIIFKHLTGKRSHFTLAASSRLEDTPGILYRWVQILSMFGFR